MHDYIEGTYSLKSIPNVRKLLIANLFMLSVFGRNLVRGSHRWNILLYSCYDVWPGAWTRFRTTEIFHVRGKFIYTQNFRQKSAERKSPQKYFFFFIFSLWYLSWGLNPIPNDRQLFMANLFTLSICHRNLLRGSHRRNIFHSWFYCRHLTWGLSFLISQLPICYNGLKETFIEMSVCFWS